MTPELGKLIKGEARQMARRDAIHACVAPVEAGEILFAGDHVGLDEHGRASLRVPPVGVVDPFLKEAVNCGETFWLMVYPGTVTNLRHQWSHPSFTLRKGAPDAP